MRLHCQEHGYMDEKTGPMAECPYCEIDRLTEMAKKYCQQLAQEQCRTFKLEKENEALKSALLKCGESYAEIQ